MTRGNGDERQHATLERVEAKLDRLGELAASHDVRLGAVEDRQLKDAHVAKLRHDELMGRTAQLDAKIELIRIDLADVTREESRMAASHAETTVLAEVGRLRGELDALAQRVDELARRVSAAME